MKPKLCRECGNYMNEEEDMYWCGFCYSEESKKQQVRYITSE